LSNFIMFNLHHGLWYDLGYKPFNRLSNRCQFQVTLKELNSCHWLRRIAFNTFFSPGVNFINILPAAFSLADPKSVKRTVNLTVFFVFLGSALSKAARRMLMTLTPKHCLHSGIFHLLIFWICEAVKLIRHQKKVSKASLKTC